MNRLSYVFAVVLSVSLVGCSGGGSNDEKSVSCGFITGGSLNVSDADVAGGIQDRERAADGNLGTFADVMAGGQETIKFSDVGPSGALYKAGSHAGAFVSLVGTATTASIAVNTYRGGTLQESGTGPSLSVASTEGKTQAEDYVSVTTTKDFDEVELVISAPANSEYQIFEFCSDGAIH